MLRIILFITIFTTVLCLLVYSNLNTMVGTTMETEKGLFIYSPEGKYIEIENVDEIKMYRNKWKKD